jgi:hypothetical protein
LIRAAGSAVKILDDVSGDINNASRLVVYLAREVVDGFLEVEATGRWIGSGVIIIGGD